MTVVYADSVFILNAVTDYLLLLATARLAGIPLRRRRFLFSALLGGGYAVAVFLPGLAFLAAAPAKLAVGGLLALTAFGGEDRLLRLTLLLFAVSCGFAGCVLGLGLLLGGMPMVNGILYTNVDTGVLAAAFGAGYLVLRLVFRASARHALRGELVPLRLSVGGKTAVLTALRDTGSTLRDAVSGQAVLVVAPGQIEHLLPSGARRLLRQEGLGSPAELLEPLLRASPELRPSLMPFRAVGTAEGLLLTIRTDWLEIAGVRHHGARAALSPTDLGSGYGALWGGE